MWEQGGQWHRPVHQQLAHSWQQQLLQQRQQQVQQAHAVPAPLPPAPQQQQAWQRQMQRSPAELAFLKGERLACGWQVSRRQARP